MLYHFNFGPQQIRGFWSKLFAFLRAYRPHPIVLIGVCLVAAVSLIALVLVLLVALCALLVVCLFGLGLLILGGTTTIVLDILKALAKWIIVLFIAGVLATKTFAPPEGRGQAAKKAPPSYTQRAASPTRRWRTKARYFYARKPRVAPS